MLNVKLKDIELSTPSDGDICFNTDTGKYSLWYKYKYYAIPEEAIELSEQIKCKSSRKVLYHKDNSDILRELLFEIYSAGFEAGMLNKDIVNSYNDFYDDILRRFNS